MTKDEQYNILVSSYIGGFSIKTISSIVIAILIVSFLFFVFPEKGNAGGFGEVPIEMGCAQIVSEDDMFRCCDFEPGLACALKVGEQVVGSFEGETCNNQTGLCSGFDPMLERNVPTISQWGLISMAGVLGIIGFTVFKRRKVTT